MIFQILLSAAIAAPLCMDTSEEYSSPSAGNYSTDFQLTPDGNYAYTNGYGAGKFLIIDLKTGNQKEIEKSPQGYVTINGTDALIQDYSELSIYTPENIFNYVKNTGFKAVDLKTGQASRKKGFVPFRGGYAEALKIENNEILIKDNKGKIRSLPVMGSRQGENYSQGDTVSAPSVTHSYTKGSLKIEPVSAKEFELTIPGIKDQNMQGELSPDNKFYILKSGNYNSDNPPPLFVIDVEKQSYKKIDIPKNTSFNNMKRPVYNAKTGDLLLQQYGTSAVVAVNLKEGAIKTLNTPSGDASGSNSFYFNKKGQVCKLTSSSTYENGRLVSQGSFRSCADPGQAFPSPGEKISEEGTLSALSDDAFMMSSYNGSGSSTNSLLVRSETCAQKEITVDCNCEVEKPTDGTSNLEDLKSVVLAAACSAPYDAKNWASLTPPVTSTLSEGQAVVWLKRFSKSGGTDPQKDLDVLLAILNSKVPVAYPRLTKSALRSLMTNSPNTFNSVTKKFPKLIELKGIADQSCLTDTEKKEVQVATYKTLSEEFKKPSTYERLSKLAIQGADGLSDTQKQSLADTASDRMTEVGARNGPTYGVFASKIHKFSLYQFQKLMGLPSPDITDFTVIRTRDEMTIMQLGRDSFTGSKITPSGVNVKELGKIRIDDIKSDSRTEKYKWKYGGKDYIGELSIDKIAFDESHMPANKSPDYKDMWKDKEFRGVVVAGTNLGQPLTQETMNQYVEYYTQKGFTFGDVKDNDDMLNYLKEKVSGTGQMDYFIKEAHSGGDEKTMFDIAKKGKVLIGSKQQGDRKEVVELIFPGTDSSYSNSVSIGNSEFGQWARDREKAGGSELMYLNTSCNSESKAIYEIPAAATAKLVNIPTTSAVTTFANWKSNIMLNLVEGIRQEKDYAGIRELLKNNEEYKEGKGNRIVFPDEADYRTRIVDRIRTPFELNSKVSVKNASGQYENYNIGQQ